MCERAVNRCPELDDISLWISDSCFPGHMFPSRQQQANTTITTATLGMSDICINSLMFPAGQQQRRSTQQWNPTARQDNHHHHRNKNISNRQSNRKRVGPVQYRCHKRANHALDRLDRLVSWGYGEGPAGCCSCGLGRKLYV